MEVNLAINHSCTFSVSRERKEVQVKQKQQFSLCKSAFISVFVRTDATTLMQRKVECCELGDYMVPKFGKIKAFFSVFGLAYITMDLPLPKSVVLCEF